MTPAAPSNTPLADIASSAVPDLSLGLQGGDPSQGSLAEILQVTKDIFGGLVEVENGFDPDFPDEQWLVIIVENEGTTREILDREMDWHQRVLKVNPDYTSHVRLCIFPK